MYHHYIHQWISIREPGRKHFIVGILYRPPAGSLKCFLNELKDALTIVFDGAGMDEHIVMGDCNIDFSRCENTYSKKLKDLMIEYNLIRLETSFTRITQRNKSTIDVIFSDMCNIMDVGVRQFNISDHLPIYVIKKKPRNRITREVVEFRNLKHYSVEELETLIRADRRWIGFWDENVPVDVLWQTMYTIFLDSLNELCPMMKCLSQTDRPNWVTKEVVEAIQEKNILYKHAQVTSNDEDWRLFRVQKKKTKKLITETKCRSMKNRLGENRGNPKKFWRQVNNEILGRQDGEGLKVIRNSKGEHITGKEAADYINQIYSEMGIGNHNADVHWREQSMNMDMLEPGFNFRFIELLEVHQYVKGLDVNKSSGIEGISTNILKDCLTICEFEITYVINCSVQQKKFPSAWKRCIVTPIPKTGDKLDAENWRPINNLCVPGKLLEKCIYRQIEEYMEKSRLICNNQHGFRKGRGTDTAVMDLVRELFDNINNNEVSSTLFLDFSRAFNSVNHQILIRKMKMYGFADNVCAWFKDYFSDRLQYTKVGKVLSSGVAIEHGVYQGSPLGPLLFIIYINDIINVNDKMFCNMYADDTVIVSSSIDVDKAISDVRMVLGEIQDWCLMNNIKLNNRKTKHMLVGKQRMEVTKTVCDTISNVESFVYLGVNMDRRLNFEKFIDSTISRVNGRLITLARIRKMLDEHTSLLIYKQTILPILDYVSVLVNSSTQRKVSKLQPLQNRAIRIIKRLTGYISTEDMDEYHKRLKLKFLNIRRKTFMLMLIYKLSRIKENVNTVRPDRQLRTGPKVKMKIAFTDKERVLRSPFYKCNRLWDKLSSDIQLSDNIFEFKTKLKKIDLFEI